MAGRILYLSQWFDPEVMVKGLKFVRHLQASGYEIEVATGVPNYPSGKIAPGYRLKPYQSEMMGDVLVHRLFLFPSHDQSSLGRALNYGSFFLSALLFCLLRARRFDAVYVYHPPITVGLAAALSGFVTRRPFLIDVQDLWPDSVSASGMAGTGHLARILGPLCSFVYLRAAHVIGQSHAMTECLIQRGASRDRTSTIFNWADEDAAKPGGRYEVNALKFANRFNFVFGGNLGRAQGLEVLIRAAHEAALEVPEIQLTIIGEGVERNRLEELIHELGTDAVKLLPGVPQSHIGDVFAAADVLVIHLIDNPLFAITVPSKTQFYMAMGKPILVGVRGEAAAVVTRAGAGVAVPPDDVGEMSAAMVRMARTPRNELRTMGDQAKQVYIAQYSFDRAMDATRACIHKVLASAASSVGRSGTNRL